MPLAWAGVGAIIAGMATDGSAPVFCFTPRPVPVSQVEDHPPALSAPSAPAGACCSAPALPSGPCPVCPRLDLDFEAWRQAGYSKSLHQRAVARELLLKPEHEQLQARIRFLEHQLFGRKSEASACQPAAPLADSPAMSPPTCPRPKGQPRGKPGPKRRDYSHLPADEEVRELPVEQPRCAQCGRPLELCLGTEDSTILEVAVRAHRRVIRRRRYRPTCTCGGSPGIVTAPTPLKVFAKTIFGVSIWVSILLDKYLFYRPTERLLAEWASPGLDLSLGSLTDGLKRLVPLFEPLYEALAARSQQQKLWHADETRWLVFATVEGKVGYRWYLWVFHAKEVVVFVLAMGRAHAVPEDHLGPEASGIMVVDRFTAYPAIEQVKRGAITLAFCWAHVRRDFLEVARGWPQLEAWGLGWVERIGELYSRNDARCKVLDQPAAFAEADRRVRAQVDALEEQAQAELADPQLHPAARKTLASLGDHGTGLTVFVEDPEVPMDNNTAERAERGPVVGRKNYYGSGAVWSGQWAAMLFSRFQTLCLGNINPRVWLTAYLQACAEAGGQAPAAAVVQALLPWNLPAQQRRDWSLHPPAADTS